MLIREMLDEESSPGPATASVPARARPNWALPLGRPVVRVALLMLSSMAVGIVIGLAVGGGL